MNVRKLAQDDHQKIFYSLQGGSSMIVDSLMVEAKKQKANVGIKLRKLGVTVTYANAISFNTLNIYSSEPKPQSLCGLTLCYFVVVKAVLDIGQKTKDKAKVYQQP
ncbi:unnamed protein product [Microthlaspi erraticum]|uniref:Uncharacterized protein n=1 Tax=Microthlaspi erraticum TaxID=1685480 RepID=A0A6D2HKI2_9BRAS|nr:unnamed protein product [Microthlaspi erraticum]